MRLPPSSRIGAYVVDKPKEACGVFGIYAPGEDVARIAFFGIFALQHRGQESAGIATADGVQLRLHTGMGLVSQAFQKPDLERLGGHIAIGHTRYSTTGSSKLSNAQPILSNGPWGTLAIAHNGNLVNARELRQELEDQGVEFTTSTDSESIAHMLARAPGKSWEERLRYTVGRLRGAFSVTILTPDVLIGLRDPRGVRPLCLGKFNNGWVMASESCALDHIGAQFEREIEPGEAVIVDKDGLRSFRVAAAEKPAPCVFEHIYFARPDSVLGGNLLYQSRQAMGAQLALEHPVEADLVMGVPDSATAAGLGYAQASGIPYSDLLMKNRYVGRTFIQPDQHLRELGVRLKFNPLSRVIEGKRIVVVDDSIVRGTTTPHVVGLLRKAGAKAVHMRICAPPIRWPCHFGVDMATRGELIAAQKTVEEIRQFVDADSLGYLSREGMTKAVKGGPGASFCMACFTGEYPIPVQLEMDKLSLETVKQ